ncbi:MAG: DEAD/DEAH box helicase family protein [Thermoproteus sp.]
MLYLVWDRGTVVLSGDVPAQVRSLSFIKFDNRVGKYRALGMYYYKIKAVLDSLGVRYEDGVLSPVCRSVEAARRPVLRPYQEEALGNWLRSKRGVVVMPTGAGKTYVAIEAIARLGQSALVVVPTIELLRQWERRLSEYFPGRVGVWYGEEKRELCITVTTYDSAYVAVEHLGNRYPLLVFDEVHHLPSESYRQIAELSPAPYRLGLTATPERADDLHLFLPELVGPVVYKMAISEAAGKYLAEFDVEVVKVGLSEEEMRRYKELEKIYKGYIRAKGLRFKSPSDFGKLVVLAGRSAEARRALEAWHEMRRILFESKGKVDAVADILKKHPDGKILIFTEYTALAREVSRRYLIPEVTYDMPDQERELVMEMFRRGEVRALVTGRVLDEGVDVPDVDVVVILGGTSSSRQYIQRIGRALRLKPHKAKIYEVVTARTREVDMSRRRRRGVS